VEVRKRRGGDGEEGESEEEDARSVLWYTSEFCLVVTQLLIYYVAGTQH